MEAAFVRLTIERVDQSGQESSFAFPLRGAVATLTALRPEIEQISHCITEHVEGIDGNRQAQSGPERQRLFKPDSRVQIGINQVDQEIEPTTPVAKKRLTPETMG